MVQFPYVPSGSLIPSYFQQKKEGLIKYGIFKKVYMDDYSILCDLDHWMFSLSGK